MSRDFQVLPPLSDEEYAALRVDIAQRGVLVPVVVESTPLVDQ
jgi:ParB-like chromosome segregation protein Spo0J